jgi:hypothetical protein
MLLQLVSERTSSPLRCQRHPRAPKVWWCVEGPERAYAACSAFTIGRRRLRPDGDPLS